MVYTCASKAHAVRHMGSTPFFGTYMKLVFRIGKKDFVGFPIEGALATLTKKSKAEIKRLERDGAIDIYIEGIVRTHVIVGDNEYCIERIRQKPV